MCVCVMGDRYPLRVQSSELAINLYNVYGDSIEVCVSVRVCVLPCSSVVNGVLKKTDIKNQSIKT